MDIKGKIWKWLYEKCDEYLGEEEFEEVWFELLNGKIGIGIVKYESGKVGLEIWMNWLGCLGIDMFKMELSR